MITDPEQACRDSAVALVTIGLCVAIERNIISPHEAMAIFFSPATFKHYSSNSKIRHLLHLASELGSVKTVLPERFSESVAEVKELAMSALADRPSITSLGEQTIRDLLWRDCK